MDRIPRVAVVGLSGQSIFLSSAALPAPGETVRADRLSVEPGGKGFNQAVAAARLGAQVDFITALGDDGDADACERALKGESIRVHAVRKPLPHRTALAVIHTDAAGENCVTVYRGASDLISADDIRRRADAIRWADCLLAQLETPLDALLEAERIARGAGVPVILNPAPASRPLGELPPDVLLTPNRLEAAALLGLEPGKASFRDLLARLRARGVTRAVITLGSDGALVLDGREGWHVSAAPARPVDTTGAGDVFSAALAVRLCLGDALVDAARYAANAGALHVERPGVFGAIPTAREIAQGWRECPSTRIPD